MNERGMSNTGTPDHGPTATSAAIATGERIEEGFSREVWGTDEERQAAHRAVVAEAEALPAEQVLERRNFSLLKASTLILVQIPRIAGALGELEAKTTYREQDLKKLQRIALGALVAAQAEAPVDPRWRAAREKVDEGKALFDSLDRQALTSTIWDGVDEAEYRALRLGRRPSSLPTDIEKLVRFFEAHEELEHKTRIPWSHVGQAKRILEVLPVALEVLQHAGGDPHVRVASILFRAYEHTRKTLAYALDSKQKANAIAPSLFPSGVRSKRAAKDGVRDASSTDAHTATAKLELAEPKSRADDETKAPHACAAEHAPQPDRTLRADPAPEPTTSAGAPPVAAPMTRARKRGVVLARRRGRCRAACTVRFIGASPRDGRVQGGLTHGPTRSCAFPQRPSAAFSEDRESIEPA